MPISPKSALVESCKIIIRETPVVQFSKIKKGKEITRTDRVVIVDSSGKPITDPPVGFQERGFSDPDLLAKRSRESLIYLNKAVLMYSNHYGEWNFEHWMLDVIPKAWHARSKPDFEEVTFVLTGGQFEDLTIEYLTHIGVRKENILKILEADLEVGELIEFVPHYSYPFSVESADFMKCLREVISEKIIKKPEKKSKLFLGRTELNKSGSGRYIENLSELVKMLNEEDFDFVSAGDLDLIGKHEMFSNAEIVVSEIGANCLNVLISSDVKKFIQIGHQRWKKTYYSDIFETINPNSESVCMFFETSDPEHNSYKSPEGVNVPWKVDVERLRTEIRKS